jgi:Uma2 family endonuclease
MVAAHNLSRFTPEEYFAWEERQECKHEYMNGEVYAMTGGTINHSRVALNFGFMLMNHLRGRCMVLNSDARVEVQRSRQYVYPDVSVTCDRRDLSNTNFVSHPCLIVEVLSPSTEAYDRGGKFKLYRRSSSLQDYVLVSADKIEIDLYRKSAEKWEILSYSAGDLVELESINFTFPIEQLYQGIVFQSALHDIEMILPN